MRARALMRRASIRIYLRGRAITRSHCRTTARPIALYSLIGGDSNTTPVYYKHTTTMPRAKAPIRDHFKDCAR